MNPHPPPTDARALTRRLVDRLADELLPGVLAGDPHWLARLQAPGSGLAWADGELVFTLPQLYRLLGGSDDDGYRAFVSHLYRSDLNARLRALGAAVVVHQPHREAARRQYRLARTRPVA